MSRRRQVRTGAGAATAAGLPARRSSRVACGAAKGALAGEAASTQAAWTGFAQGVSCLLRSRREAHPAPRMPKTGGSKGGGKAAGNELAEELESKASIGDSAAVEPQLSAPPPRLPLRQRSSLALLRRSRGPAASRRRLLLTAAPATSARSAYRTVSAVSGPLVILERVQGAKFGEIVNVTLANSEYKRGQVCPPRPP